MARRLVRKRQADRDLAAHVEYIARERPASARRYLIAVERAFQRIARLPELGALRACRERRLAGLRVWPVPHFERFLIFYRVTESAVEVIRVLHSARNVERLLGGTRRR